jgi:hypothetical protein
MNTFSKTSLFALTLGLAIVATAACSGDPGGDPDHGDTGTDVEVPDTRKETDPPPPPPPVCSAVDGTGAFAQGVSGVGDVKGDAPGSSMRKLALDLVAYFPKGRVAGEKIVLAIPAGYPRGGLITGSATLGADKSAKEIKLDGYTLPAPGGATHGLKLDARIDADGTIHGDVTYDFGSGDVSDTAKGKIDFCTKKEAPAPSLDIASAGVPGASYFLRATAPIDVETTKEIVFKAGAKSYPAKVTAGQAFMLDAELPPNQELELDVSKVKDILGRPLTLATKPPVLKTTAVLADRTFATAPTAGALVSSPAAALEFVAEGKLLQFRGPAAAGLVALGDLAGAKKIHLQGATESCDGGTNLSVIDAEGKRIPISAECKEGKAPFDVKIELSGKAPYWIGIVNDRVGTGAVSLPAPPTITKIKAIATES